MTKTLTDFVETKLSEFFELAKSNGLKITESKKETFDKFMTETKSNFANLVKSEIKKEKKEKKPKDKNAPKRGKSAFIFFSMEKRPEIKEEEPEMKSNDVVREIGKLWKETTAEEKEEYQKLAAEDKVRYQTEKEAYEQDHASSSDSAKEKKVAVKKSKSGYQLFSDEKRSEIKENNPEIKPKDVMKELGKLWSELEDEEKAVYNDKAKTLKEKDSDSEEEKPSKAAVVEEKPKKVEKKKVVVESESEQEKPKKKVEKKKTVKK